MSPRSQLAAEVACVFALGVLVSVAAAWGTDLGAGVLGTQQADKWGAIYLHDAFHRAVAGGSFPLVDHEQLWPVGAPLAAMNGDNVVEMLVSGLLRLVAAWPRWFNLAHLAWPPLLALAFLPLGHRLWPGGGVSGALVRAASSLSWAMSPVFFGEITAGRLTQVVLVGLPLALAQLTLASERDLTRRETILGVVGIALTGLGYWYYAIFLALLSPVFLVAAHRGGRIVATAHSFAWMGVGAAVIVSPALFGVVWASLSTGVSVSLPLPPGGLSPVFDNALQLARAQPEQLRGWLPWALVPGLLLAGVASARRRGSGALWLSLAALALVFALGPGQRLGERVWLLPYWPLWKAIPLLERLTHPSRWLDFGMIFLVVASFGGLATLRPARWLAPLIPAVLLAQLFVQRTLPLPSFAMPVPALWSEVARGEGALIVVPVMHAPGSCRWQAFHHRAVVGGMAEGLPFAWPAAFRAGFEGNALLLQLLAMGDGKLGALDLRQGDVDALIGQGFTQIALDLEAWRRWGRGGGIDPLKVLRASLGAPLYEGPEGALWTLPTSALSGHATPPAGTRLPPP